MERGIKLFGLLLVSGGAVWLIATGFIPTLHSARTAHSIMGACFGLGHLLYGAYLHFTERRSRS
jgi:hypothetical protein